MKKRKSMVTQLGLIRLASFADRGFNSFDGEVVLVTQFAHSWENGCKLVQAHGSLDRLNQLSGVIADAILEYQLDVLDVRNFCTGIAVDHYQIRLLASFERPDTIGFA